MSQGMRKTVKHAEGIVTVWASKGWNEVETLHFFESVMTSEVHHAILEENLVNQRENCDSR